MLIPRAWGWNQWILFALLTVTILQPACSGGSTGNEDNGKGGVQGSTGGESGASGMTITGGTTGVSEVIRTGGNPGTGGAGATGGATASGGTVGTGGNPGTGGSTGGGTVYYFSDCQTGAAVGCVSGNDTNTGTSPAAPKQTLAGINVNT